MPRSARLDQPGALHHVIARGIERRDIFVDDADRADLVERLGRLADTHALDVYAWALMPNHIHLLVRTRAQRLSSSMRSLLGGYATMFNRRHGRVGHLFQNRYKSILCDEEAYFHTLLRYIHLNPIKGAIVATVADLDDYPWTGHAAIVRRCCRPWQDVDFVLASFAGTPSQAIRRYRTSLSESLRSDGSMDLDGGGLVRSAAGLRIVPVLQRGRERFRSDERILGRTEFTITIQRELEAIERRPEHGPLTIDLLIDRVATALGVSAAVLMANGRSPVQTKAREAVAFLWTSGLGRTGLSAANRLGITPSAVYAAANRGKRDRDRWLKLLDSLSPECIANLTK